MLFDKDYRRIKLEKILSFLFMLFGLVQYCHVKHILNGNLAGEANAQEAN